MKFRELANFTVRGKITVTTQVPYGNKKKKLVIKFC